jgi:hypothetical protein
MGEASHEVARKVKRPGKRAYAPDQGMPHDPYAGNNDVPVNAPLGSEMLEHIRRIVRETDEMQIDLAFADRLLAEVDRLRAENYCLRSEIAGVSWCR